MKNKFIKSLVALFVLISVNTFAQKSVAQFNRNSCRAVVGQNVNFTFVLDNIKDESEKAAFVSKFKTNKAMNVTASALTGDKATFVVSFQNNGAAGASLETLLANSGVDNVKVDDKVMPANQLQAYMKAHNKN